MSRSACPLPGLRGAVRARAMASARDARKGADRRADRRADEASQAVVDALRAMLGMAPLYRLEPRTSIQVFAFWEQGKMTVQGGTMKSHGR